MSTEISGLWIEYHGSYQPAIIGQWLVEAGSFDLSDAEEITQISTWVSKDRRENIDGPQLGKVVGLSVSTSLQRSSGFVGTKTEGSIRLRFQANRYEKLVCYSAVFVHHLNLTRLLHRILSCGPIIILQIIFGCSLNESGPMI